MSNQIIILDTVVGPKELRAPAGWEFDKTSTHVWSALLSETRRAPKLGKDKHARQHTIDVLSNILANVLGMAGFYWEQEAKRILGEGL